MNEWLWTIVTVVAIILAADPTLIRLRRKKKDKPMNPFKELKRRIKNYEEWDLKVTRRYGENIRYEITHISCRKKRYAQNGQAD
jgi:hypothetical protein